MTLPAADMRRRRISLAAAADMRRRRDERNRARARELRIVRRTPVLVRFPSDLLGALSAIADGYQSAGVPLPQFSENAVATYGARGMAGDRWTRHDVIVVLLRRVAEDLGYLSAAARDERTARARISVTAPETDISRRREGRA